MKPQGCSACCCCCSARDVGPKEDPPSAGPGIPHGSITGGFKKSKAAVPIWTHPQMKKTSINKSRSGLNLYLNLPKKKKKTISSKASLSKCASLQRNVTTPASFFNPERYALETNTFIQTPDFPFFNAFCYSKHML